MTPKQKELLTMIKNNGTISINQARLIYANPQYLRDIVKHLSLKGLIVINYGNLSLTKKGIEELK